MAFTGSIEHAWTDLSLTPLRPDQIANLERLREEGRTSIFLLDIGPPGHEEEIALGAEQVLTVWAVDDDNFPEGRYFIRLAREG